MATIWEDKKRLLLFGLPWTFTKYTLNDEKLMIKSGFLSVNYDEVRLYRIMDLSLKQTLIQRIFKLGTIKVSSRDKTMGDFELKNIVNSKNVKELLSDTIEKERVKKRVSSREFMVDDDDDDDDCN